MSALPVSIAAPSTDNARRYFTVWGEKQRLIEVTGDPSARMSCFGAGEMGTGRGKPGDMASSELMVMEVDGWLKKNATADLMVIMRQYFVYGWEYVEKMDRIEHGDGTHTDIPFDTPTFTRQQTFTLGQIELGAEVERVLQRYRLSKAFIVYQSMERLLKLFAKEKGIAY